MPASDDDCAVCKMIRVSTNGDGPADISGVLLVLDHAGAPQVIADGAVVTARRTAATTAYITDLLALPEASVLALFGAGALAFPHVEAIDVVRPLSEIRVVARRSASSAELAATLRARGWNAWAATPSEAVAGADIITTLTTARVPVFADSDIAPGVHINAVGAHRADMREIPATTFGRVRGVATDSPDTVLVEAGDVIHAREEGFLDHAPTFIDIRDRDGMAALRQQRTDVTLFKSVGHAISDLAAARLILRRLRAEVAGG
jgi:ornithine cyclodeaminase